MVAFQRILAATKPLYRLIFSWFIHYFQTCPRFLYVKELHREIFYTCKCFTPFKNFLLFSAMTTQNRHLSGCIVGGSKRANFFTQKSFFWQKYFFNQNFFQPIFFCFGKKKKKNSFWKKLWPKKVYQKKFCQNKKHLAEKNFN